MTSSIDAVTRDWDGLTIPAAGTYALDVAHKRVGFVARHMMVSKVRGEFNEATATITIAALSLFAQINIMTQGGPANATLVYVLLNHTIVAVIARMPGKLGREHEKPSPSVWPLEAGPQRLAGPVLGAVPLVTALARAMDKLDRRHASTIQKLEERYTAAASGTRDELGAALDRLREQVGLD